MLRLTAAAPTSPGMPSRMTFLLSAPVPLSLSLSLSRARSFALSVRVRVRSGGDVSTEVSRKAGGERRTCPLHLCLPSEEGQGGGRERGIEIDGTPHPTYTQQCWLGVRTGTCPFSARKTAMTAVPRRGTCFHRTHSSSWVRLARAHWRSRAASGCPPRGHGLVLPRSFPFAVNAWTCAEYTCMLTTLGRRCANWDKSAHRPQLHICLEFSFVRPQTLGPFPACERTSMPLELSLVRKCRAF
jgi:hypothetical protein